MRLVRLLLIELGLGLLGASTLGAGTVALWLFDEQEGVYASSPLNDAASGSYSVVLGRGGEIVPGRFGRALHVMTPRAFDPSFDPDGIIFKEVTQDGLVETGLKAPPDPSNRTVEPMTWFNATFAAAFVNGDRHLPRRTTSVNASDSKLNLGSDDWTVEFWLRLDDTSETDGVIFEIGSGPRGENEQVTRLVLSAGGDAFEFFNAPSGTRVRLPTDKEALRSGGWVHCAFVYSASKGELQHYANGIQCGGPAELEVRALPHGDESYFSLGRDGNWNRPLTGALDEMRISDRAVYTEEFSPPASFARMHNGSRMPFALKSGPPLLFARPATTPIELGSRRHVFIDDALIETRTNIAFTAHPARVAERVLEEGGWISVVEDGDKLVRLYVTGPENSVAVFTSRDGINFTAPDLGRSFKGRRNVVLTDPASVGCVFRDPNGPPDERWKLVSGLRGRGGIYVYTSSDGFDWRRHESTALPFWAGSAVNVFYDDQRQCYVIHNRSDYYRTPGGAADRKSVLTEVKDLLEPWPFRPVGAADTQAAVAAGVRTRAPEIDPWWMTHGPLAPGRLGLEFPVAFSSDPAVDPVGTDVYNTRAQKYAWAEDTYVAFPLFFFHYPHDGPPQRQILAHPDEERGTGLVETQLAVSRDGLTWLRYPRPAYVGIGEVDGYPMLRPYTGYGMVRRGREIWQYCHTRASYHDGYGGKSELPNVIHRLVQRVDGFVSVDAPYTGGEFITKPFRFTGNRLMLNIDTDATGVAQIGFLDEHGAPIPGYTTDDCVYINGDEIDYPVEWLDKNLQRANDVSALAGKTVRLVVRMRGTSLYALQFVN